MKKKVCAVFLTAAVVLGGSVTVFAEETTPYVPLPIIRVTPFTAIGANDATAAQDELDDRAQ